MTLTEKQKQILNRYPSFNTGGTAENFRSGLSDESIESTRTEVKDAFRAKGFMADIKGIGTGIKESAINRSDKFGEIDKSVARGDTGTAEALFQKFGQGAGFASDIVGETFLGALKALTPQGIQEKVGDKVTDVATKVAESETAKKLGTWYQNLDENAQRDLQSIIGIGSLGLDVAGGFLAKKPVTNVAKNVADKTLETSKKAVDFATDITKGTKGLDDLGGGIAKDVIDTPSDLLRRAQTNIAENQARRQAIRELPSQVAQRAVRDDVDILDVQRLYNLPKDNNGAYKKLAEVVKQFETGSTSQNPLEVIGKPVVERLKSLDADIKKFGTQLDTVAESLKGKTLQSSRELLTEADNSLAKLGITKVDDGSLSFAGSNIEGLGNANENVIKQVYKRLQEATDASDYHRLKKYIDNNVDFGKSTEGFVGEAESLLKTWRKQIDTALDTEFADYKLVNDELSKRLTPVKEMKNLLKATGDLSENQDLVELGAGLIARRLTSNSVSNPKIRLILRAMDEATTVKGKTSLNVESLMDFYNILEKYYDVAPKTGFQGQITSGIEKASNLQGIVIDALGKLSGRSNAVRKKALEDILNEVFGSGPQSFNQGAIPKIAFERAKDLSPEYRAIETRAFDKIKSSEKELIDKYTSQYGRVVNTDDFRKLFIDEGYRGYNSASVQEPSSYLSKKVFSQQLDNPQPIASFLAGGSGTGKTSAIKNVPILSENLKNSAVILDSNFSSIGSATKKIQEAISKGKAIVIDYVYRDPIDSFENGVVKRMLSNPDEMGRLVPSKVVAENHIGSWEVIKKLYNDGFDINFIDNSLGNKNTKLVDFEVLNKKINYPTVEKLTEMFNNKAKQLYESGQITKEQYIGYIS